VSDAPIHVLVVDDVELNLKLIAALLVANGFAVKTATTAESGLALLQSQPFRVLLIDLRLPGMDGLTLTRTLRADPAHRDLVIIAVTANAMKADEEAAIAAGCDAFVSKPINTRGLVPLVKELLAKGSRR
jgi:CheY-like chemotaxis protein